MKTKRNVQRRLSPARGSTAGVYRVWVEQVNQTYLDVKASTPEEAAEKGYQAWRRGYAHSRVSWVEKQ